MKNLLRASLLAPLLAGSALVATPAFAQDESEITVSANVAMVTDYRFRGVSYSGGDFAIQGGFDIAHSSGFYVGTWASSLDPVSSGYGNTELDIYGGYSGAISDTISFDVGILYYLYPSASGDTELEANPALSAPITASLVQRASRPPLRRAPFPERIAKEAICIRASGRASKITPTTPRGTDTRSRRRPSSSSRWSWR